MSVSSGSNTASSTVESPTLVVKNINKFNLKANETCLIMEINEFYHKSIYDDVVRRKTNENQNDITSPNKVSSIIESRIKDSQERQKDKEVHQFKRGSTTVFQEGNVADKIKKYTTPKTIRDRKESFVDQNKKR